MALSPSPDTRLSGRDRDILLDIADTAIADGLLGRTPSAPPVELLPPASRQHRGIFVTLTVGGTLNGCIGSVAGIEPLGHGSARHVWSVAFADPRLPALAHHDYDQLVIEVSVLSPLRTLPASSRRDALNQLRPGADGLVIAADRHHQAVFLPAVGDQLPEPSLFLDHLQLKAGLPPRQWPANMRAWRFSAEKFARHAGEQPSPSRAT
jgi:AmmeMemoRadiSam system protein A